MSRPTRALAEQDQSGTTIPGAGPRRAFGPLLTTGGRLRFLDLARGLAIVFMVFQHVQIIFAVGSGEDSALGVTFLLLGTAPAAPVFMVAMGFLFGSSSRTGMRERASVRGLAAVRSGLCAQPGALLAAAAGGRRRGDSHPRALRRHLVGTAPSRSTSSSSPASR